MDAIGRGMVAAWGSEAIVARLVMVPCAFGDGLPYSSVLIADERVRAPHIVCLSFPRGMPDGLIERLAQANVYVAPRLGRVRISPHVYNDETDADRFVEVFRRDAD